MWSRQWFKDQEREQRQEGRAASEGKMTIDIWSFGTLDKDVQDGIYAHETLTPNHQPLTHYP